jgi:hypothetical protein
VARSRNIKPGFFLNEELAALSAHARLLFISLWCLADREGRLEDRVKRIDVATFPYETIDTDALLNDLAKRGFIVRYEVDGRRYISIPTFLRHQKPHPNETASVIPAATRNIASGVSPRYEVTSNLGTSDVPPRYEVTQADSLSSDSLSLDSQNKSPSKTELPLEDKQTAPTEAAAEPPTGCIRNSESWSKIIRRIEQYKSTTAQHHRKGATLREDEKTALRDARDACCRAIAEKWPGCTLVGKCAEYINDRVSLVIAKNGDAPLDNPAYYFATMLKNLPNDDATAERVGRPVKEMRSGRVLR